jgi:guanylate kinase
VKQNSPQGYLFVVAAPSGAGKTSLVKALIDSSSNIEVAVSHTTRPMRMGETSGLNYYFIQREEFDALQQSGEFAESAEVFGNYYGTSTAEIERITKRGHDIVLEIDWQGANQIRAEIPTAKTIFILPPSINELSNRLHGRGQDDAETISARMAEAIDDISHYCEFDYILVNDDFDIALGNLKRLISGNGEDLSLERSQNALTPLLKNLLPEG